MSDTQKQRSNNQLRLYYGYIKQLRYRDQIRVHTDDGWFMMQPYKLIRHSSRGNRNNTESFRYLLKMLDAELPTTEEVTPTQQNKNKFEDVEMADLNHHIRWLEQVLWDNDIVPFNFNTK